MTAEALLSLGGNVGDRKANIDAAVDRLAALPGVTLARRSSYYRTEPVGPVAQPWFLNIGVALSTDRDREALRVDCRAIETALGRDRAREIAWGPRTVDIDVVLFGRDDSDLDRRAFVLVPLAEIAPDWAVAGTTLAALAAATDGRGIQRLDWPVPRLPDAT